MMLVQELHFKTHCARLFQNHESDNSSSSCPLFGSSLKYSGSCLPPKKNSRMREYSSGKTGSHSWPRFSKLASPRSARSSHSWSSSLTSHRSPKENGCRKSLHSDRVHSWRFNKSTRAPATPLLPLPWDLLCHHGREPGHDNPDLSERSASHPHVLFPQQPVLRGSLLLLSHHP